MPSVIGDCSSCLSGFLAFAQKTELERKSKFAVRYHGGLPIIIDEEDERIGKCLISFYFMLSPEQIGDNCNGVSVQRSRDPHLHRKQYHLYKIQYTDSGLF